jgi:hypothetical protein
MPRSFVHTKVLQVDEVNHEGAVFATETVIPVLLISVAAFNATASSTLFGTHA